MTEAETTAIMAGHQILMSEEAANFRNIFTAIIKTNSKEKKMAEQMWPLPTDHKPSSMTFKDRMNLYSLILANNKNEC